MFKNIKKASEYSLFGNRFVYQQKDKPAPSKSPAAKPTVSKKLDALKNSIASDFRKHLDDHREGVMKFINSEAAEKYDPGEWSKWNVKLLEFMGYENVSEEDAKGIIKRIQEYLKTADIKVAVDGMFGPNLLKGLNKYYKNLERESGFVKGKTKVAFYGEYNTPYYLTYNNEWVDQEHKPVDISKVLPTLAASMKTPINDRQYYALKSTDGHTYYIDRHGNTYKDAMPPQDGPTEEHAKGRLDYFDPFLEQAEDPRKKAREYVVNAVSGPGVRSFYRYPNGTFVDESGKKVQAKEVIPLIHRYAAEEGKVDIYEGLHGIEIEDDKIAYYNVNGDLVTEVDKNQAPEEAPHPRSIKAELYGAKKVTPEKGRRTIATHVGLQYLVGGTPIEVAETKEREAASGEYMAAVELHNAGNHKQALNGFMKSYDIVASPNSRWMIAVSLDKLNRKPEALEQANLALAEAKKAAKKNSKYKRTAKEADIMITELEITLGIKETPVSKPKKSPEPPVIPAPEPKKEAPEETFEDTSGLMANQHPRPSKTPPPVRSPLKNRDERMAAAKKVIKERGDTKDKQA